MRFEPMTDEEAAESGGGEFALLAPGTYRWVVDEAVEKESSSGNEMIALTLEHTDADGRIHKCWDYLVGTKKADWKVRQFAIAAGLKDKYDQGELTSGDCQGCIVDAEIMHTKANPEKGWSAGLKVKAYPGPDTVASRAEAVMTGQPPAATGNHQPVADDDIPF